MTHRAGETGLTQAADKLRDDKDTNQTDNSLREFGKCAVVLPAGAVSAVSRPLAITRKPEGTVTRKSTVNRSVV